MSEQVPKTNEAVQRITEYYPGEIHSFDTGKEYADAIDDSRKLLSILDDDALIELQSYAENQAIEYFESVEMIPRLSVNLMDAAPYLEGLIAAHIAGDEDTICAIRTYSNFEDDEWEIIVYNLVTYVVPFLSTNPDPVIDEHQYDFNQKRMLNMMLIATEDPSDVPSYANKSLKAEEAADEINEAISCMPFIDIERAIGLYGRAFNEVINPNMSYSPFIVGLGPLFSIAPHEAINIAEIAIDHPDEAVCEMVVETLRDIAQSPKHDLSNQDVLKLYKLVQTYAEKNG